MGLRSNTTSSLRLRQSAVKITNNCPLFINICRKFPNIIPKLLPPSKLWSTIYYKKQPGIMIFPLNPHMNKLRGITQNINLPTRLILKTPNATRVAISFLNKATIKSSFFNNYISSNSLVRVSIRINFF